MDSVEKTRGKKSYKWLYILIGIILLLDGGYKLYKSLSKDDTAKDNAVMINETIADKNGVEFCVTKVEDVKSVGSGYAEVTTDNNFVVVTIKITNNGKDPYDVNSLRFLLINGDTEYEYAEDTILAFDNYAGLDTLNPGISREYTIVYETPTATNECEFEMKIKTNAFVDDDCVYITLGEKK